MEQNQIQKGRAQNLLRMIFFSTVKDDIKLVGKLPVERVIATQ